MQMNLIHQQIEKRNLNKHKIKIKKPTCYFQRFTAYIFRDSMTESENMHTVYPSKWKLRTGVMILMSGSIVFVSKVDIKGRKVI